MLRMIYSLMLLICDLFERRVPLLLQTDGEVDGSLHLKGRDAVSRRLSADEDLHFRTNSPLTNPGDEELELIAVCASLTT